MKHYSLNEIISLYENENFYKLAYLAEEAKKEIFKDNSDKVTFVLDRNITYTNICECKCDFCAFYKEANSNEAYVLKLEEILEKINELVKINGTQVMLQGGLNSNLNLEFYINLIKKIKEKFPNITLHSFSPPEIYHIAKVSNKDVEYVLKSLYEAGLDSLPGGGGEILIDRVRKTVSKNKISSDVWLDIMRKAHKIGLKSTATMVIGLGETIYERFLSMEKVRNLQDETGGFRAFILWPFSPNKTKLSEYKVVSSIEYLKMISCARLFFNNVKNIHCGWVTEGIKIAQIALKCGANDFGGILFEEKVVKATGNVNVVTVKDLYNAAKGLGLKLARRNTKYEIIEVIEEGHKLLSI